MLYFAVNALPIGGSWGENNSEGKGLIKILHIDDDSDALILTKLWFEKINRNLDVTCSCSGQEALEYLQDNEFDCILSDLQMPGMDGMELLREVRKRGCDTPFIFFSNHSNEEHSEEAIQAGANDFIKKDVTRDQFQFLLKRIYLFIKKFNANRGDSPLHRLRPAMLPAAS